MRVALNVVVALVSLTALLALFFLWMLVPVAGILLYFLVRYVFARRRRHQPAALRQVRLAREAKAREIDIRRSAG
jgi:hypothetical protein